MPKHRMTRSGRAPSRMARIGTATLGLLAASAVGLVWMTGGRPTDARPMQPAWELDSAFSIEYRMPLVQERMEPGGRATVGELVHVVVQRVTAIERQDGRTAVRMTVGSDRLPLDLDYLLDAETGTLIRIEERLGGDETLVTPNPFGRAAVLFQKRSFAGLLADLPELGEAAVGSRRVQAPDGAYPGFTQSVVPDRDGGWLVTLSRPDPESGLDYRVIQSWRDGEPWWRSAEARLGDELLIRGRRLGTSASPRLFLPVLLRADPAGGPR